MRPPIGSGSVDLRERKRKKERIRRQSEHRRAEHLIPPAEGLLGSRSSFLIPVLVVLIGVGALLATRSRQAEVRREKRNPPERVAAEEIDALSAAVGRFRVHIGRWPTSDEGLKALVVNPGHPDWNGAYINLLHSDPWGSGYIYRQESNRLTLASCGPDRRFGTTDDILAQPIDFEVGSAWTNTWRLPDPAPGEVRIYPRAPDA